MPHVVNHDAIAMPVSNNLHVDSSKKSLVCTHCKKSGYSKNQCYRLIGFPSSFKFTKSEKEEPTIIIQLATSDNSNIITKDQHQHILQLLNQSNI